MLPPFMSFSIGYSVSLKHFEMMRVQRTKRYRSILRRVCPPHARPSCKAIRSLTVGCDPAPVRCSLLCFHQSVSISSLRLCFRHLFPQAKLCSILNDGIDINHPSPTLLEPMFSVSRSSGSLLLVLWKPDREELSPEGILKIRSHV